MSAIVEMKVSDIFQMSFGKTFFVGEITGEINLIKKSKWSVYVDNHFLKDILIEGENIPLRKTTEPTNLRTLAAVPPVKFDAIPSKNEIVLRFLENG